MNILLFDIESTPLLGWTWGTWNTNIIQVEKDWQLLCLAYKWHGKKDVFVGSWLEYTEEELVEIIWDAMDEADIVIGHNGDKFDVKKVNAKFIEFGHKPPSPFKTVDTLKIARNHAGFTSNRLDDLGEKLNVGRKLKTDFKLWLDCMNGDIKALRKMERYNIQDVKLLERVYDIVKPWTPRHPNIAVGTDRPTCGTCGSKKVHKDGTYRTNTQVYQAWECQDCGAWMRSRGLEGSKNEDKLIVADRR